MAAADSCVPLDRFRLQVELQNKNIKRDSLAREIGVDPRTLRRWLHGQTVNIQLVHVEALASVLGCKTADLMRVIPSASVPAEVENPIPTQAACGDWSEHPLLARLGQLASQEAHQQGFAAAGALLESAGSKVGFDIQAEALFRYARFAWHMGKDELARRAFEHAIMKADAAGSDLIRLRSFFALSQISPPEASFFGHQDRYLEQAEHVLYRLQSEQWRPYLWLLEARQLIRIGSNAKALHLAEEALKQLEAKHDHESLDYLEALDISSVVFQSVGKRQKSLEMLQNAEETARRILDPQHPLRGRILSRMAVANCFLGHLAESKNQAQGSIQIFEHSLGPQHRETAQAWMLLGSAYSEMGAYESALESTYQSLARLQTAAVHDMTLEARVRTNLGLILTRADRLDQAQKEADTAIQLYTHAVGAEHPETAAAMGRQGGNFLQQGNYVKAADYFLKATQLLEKSDPFHVRILDQVRNLATCYLHMGRFEDAAGVLAQHKKIYQFRDESPRYRARFALLQAKSLSRLKGKKSMAIRMAEEVRSLIPMSHPDGRIAYEAKQMAEALQR